MSEEQKNGQEKTGGEGEGGASTDDKVEQRASEIAAKQIEADAVKKAVAVYTNLNERYKEDPEFRAQFDEIWDGVKPEKREATDADADDDEPIEQMRKELKAANDKIAQVNTEIENLRNVYGYDKLSDSRARTNLKYENDFRKLAEDVGYDPGSDAYETLYADVLREGRTLAKKFGLVAENGTTDPLKEYKPEFLKEAFKVAFDRHERAGFSDAWKRKKHAESLKRDESKKDEVSGYFDPEKLKTPEQRAAALEKAFKHKFGDSFKVV